MAERASRGGRTRLNIEASIVDVVPGDSVPDLVVYTFNHSGGLLARTPMKGSEAAVPVPSTKEPENVRVMVGPPLDGVDDDDVLATLGRLNAPETLVGPDQLGEKLLIPIDRPIWVCWLRFCVVRGTLLKRATTGGIHVDGEYPDRVWAVEGANGWGAASRNVSSASMNASMTCPRSSRHVCVCIGLGTAPRPTTPTRWHSHCATLHSRHLRIGKPDDETVAVKRLYEAVIVLFDDVDDEARQAVRIPVHAVRDVAVHSRHVNGQSRSGWSALMSGPGTTDVTSLRTGRDVSGVRGQ